MELAPIDHERAAMLIPTGDGDLADRLEALVEQPKHDVEALTGQERGRARPPIPAPATSASVMA